MSGTFFKLARKVVGVKPQQEFKNLDALLEAEARQPSDDYFLAKWIAPPIVLVVGLGTFIPLTLFVHPGFLWAALGMAVISAGLWFLLHRLDIAIPRSRVRLRKIAKAIWARTNAFGALFNPDETLSPAVGEVLDEAALIYLKHAGKARTTSDLFAESRTRAISALEDAMAKMLELAEPVGSQAQELELSCGWPASLLKEMRELDAALDQQAASGLGTQDGGRDALAGLREARLELQRLDQAIEELDLGQRV